MENKATPSPSHFAFPTILEELGKGSNTSKTQEGHVDVDNASSILLIIIRGRRARAIVLLTTITVLIGLGVVASALLLTLDGTVLLSLIEEVAEVRDISGGGNSNGTLDVAQLGKLDPNS